MHASTRPARSRLLFALLYLGEGGPIGFIWWALPTWLRLQGLDVGRITILTSILVLPWVGKFLWAPLIDRTHREIERFECSHEHSSARSESD